MENKIFSQKVLEKAKELKIKPKSYFILKTALFGLSIVAFFMLILFLMSFIGFVLRINSFWHLPKFGMQGMGIFFVGLPWILIFISLVLVTLLYFFSKRFSFIYKKPVIYSLVIIMTLVLLFGFTISKTGFHKGLFDQAEKGRLPIMGAFYRNYSGQRPKQMNEGTVLYIEGNRVFIRSIEGKEHEVIIASSTKRFDFKVGDRILIFGKQYDGTIWAKKILEMK